VRIFLEEFMKKTVPIIWSIITLAALSQAQDWPQLQRDPQHTGRTSVSVTPGNTAAWVWVDEQPVTRNFVSQRDATINYPGTRSVILAGDVQPIVAGERLFFGATNGEFYALNATNGGTGITGYTVGEILFANTTTTLDKLPVGSNGFLLASNGTDSKSAAKAGPASDQWATSDP
jgi:hypothetical protein